MTLESDSQQQFIRRRKGGGGGESQTWIAPVMGEEVRTDFFYLEDRRQATDKLGDENQQVDMRAFKKWQWKWKKSV
jgi:hypothetical protein